ncbi:hypothetical protein Kpol_1066p44 [Vanderwaltozyma polyspora DSM 70294]|uniref:Uncharacterized protein n=1 Tax=Vanderwaltozyma polyspora (strain ATCC 22028 / DSM 70294 / BCRC 21397 / CBS 2163 / NBRC 10782 / NRRL Y-8283 / UCD 57-17) TaxID=436907 RepID=A7TMR3_VANPO|nr:uncharacterized protein Kpol_1066p44 [Vanderwaltozyma polyspora DSM 70294]EDO16477.1 hypothetical protein Kpol_1066p44 [Vanderwaltozyma polyspora DSM 70294]
MIRSPSIKNVYNRVRFPIVVQTKIPIRHYSSKNENNRIPDKGKILESNEPNIVEEKNNEKITSGGSNHKKSLILPRVPSTENIPVEEVQTDGLFAGYRPLFLGNCPIDDAEKGSELDRFLASFSDLKLLNNEDSDSKEVKIEDILEDIQNDIRNATNEDIGDNSRTRKPVVPWDASISGLIYNDRPFKNIPNEVVSKLKPFKLIVFERKIESNKQINGNKYIIMNVHNSKINDKTEMIDIYQVNKSKQLHDQIDDNTIIGVSKKTLIESKKKYDTEMIEFLTKFKFMKSDQRLLTNYVNKIDKILIKELYKLTKLTIKPFFVPFNLPLILYLPQCISSRNSLKRILRKHINDHTLPILSTIISNNTSTIQNEKFLTKFNSKSKNFINEISNELPSRYYDDQEIDCLLHKSPVPNFKRIYWLKKSKRNNIFYGKNIDKDYILDFNNEYNITRSNIKYMKYPICLYSKTLKEFFSGENYYD